MKLNLPRSLITTGMLLVVFLWSVMMTLPVLADGDETPPPPTATPTDVTPPPTETATPVPTEGIATSTALDPVATDTPTVDASTPTEVVPTDTPVAVPSVATEEVPASSDSNVLSQVPSDTQVVVTDANGNPLSLASADAAEAIVSSDPIWCPAGVLTPVNGGAGCSPSQTSMTDLIAWLTVNNPGVAGTIWIEKTYNSSTAVGDAGATGFTLDGLTLTNMANVALTVKGGWNGLGTGTFDTNTPSTFDGDSFSVINWKANVTLNDLLIKNVQGAGSTALTVKTTKKVTMNRVKVRDNVGSGAKIDNTASGTGTGDVAITLSQFLNNAGGHGLEVDSRGAITLSGVLADGNNNDGANLDNRTAPVAKNVTINTGVNEFNSNTTGFGLSVFSKGAVVLKDMTANKNGLYGVMVDNSAGSAQPVTITGTNIFSDNVYDGLVVWSSGAISVSNLVANNNGAWGTYLDNRTATTPLSVIVSGNNEFKYNGSALWIQSQGAITVSNITALTDPILATGNYEGVHLQNNYNFASNVTMTGINVITGIYNSGLVIYSKGAVTLNNITASDNGFMAPSPANDGDGWGVYIDNSFALTPMAVTINGKNTFNHNFSGGLKIISKGVVTLNNLKVEDNVYYGAYLDNHLGTGSVLINNMPAFSPSISYNGAAGLYVSSAGNITIMDLDAIGNGWIVAGDGVYLKNTFGSGNISVGTSRVNWFNDISGSLSSGLEVYSNGTVTLMNLIVQGDSAYGAIVHNETASSPKSVIIKGINTFTGNISSGLDILTKGAILLSNITASGGIYGAFFDNQTYGSPASPQNVTITGTNLFHGNTSDGLVIYTHGSILLNNVTSNNNGGYGAYLSNKDSATPQVVILAGTNTFSSNAAGGLVILSKGTITLSNIIAEYNRNGTNTAGGIGVVVDNLASTSAVPQNVTINGANSFIGNFYDGLAISTYGSILLNTVIASNNGGYGAYLNNSNSTTLKAVTLYGYGIFEGNTSSGLYVLTRGAITLTSITADDNTGGEGARLDNLASNAASPQNVTLNGVNSFSRNFNDGLVVTTYGMILLSNVSADGNGGFGANLNNRGGITPKSVTLNGTNFFNSNRGTGGLQIITVGAIKINNLAAYDNIGFGAKLTNAFPGAGVSITGYADFDDNGISTGKDGLMISSAGAIFISNLDSAYNGGYGVILDNSGGSAGVILSGTHNQGIGNMLDGIRILTNGAVLVSNLQTQSNHGYGIFVNNSGSGVVMPQNVTLTGVAESYYNGMDGVHITTFGSITIQNIYTYCNGYSGGVCPNSPISSTGYGAWLDNCGYDTGTSACTSTGMPRGITLTGYAVFDDNAREGLWAVSLGTISANNLEAFGNLGSGIYLNNQWDLAVGGVILTGLNSFACNGCLVSSGGPENTSANGLVIYSHGAVMLNNVSAISNKNNGVQINNVGSVSKAVTFSGLNTFSKNGTLISGSGLVIDSIGQITLNNVTAEENKANGVSLDNYTLLLPAPGVKITGINNFNKNGADGLSIYSKGMVDLNHITADFNSGNGLNVVTWKNVILACGSVNNNGGYGWYIDAVPGATILKGVNGFGNIFGNYNTTPEFVSRACPVPAPVVVERPVRKRRDIPEFVHYPQRL